MRFLAAVLAAACLHAPAATTGSIRVFSDQLPDALPPALLDFAASHYAGAQKLGRTTTEALKARNPRFFAIQYRADGRAAAGQFRPTGISRRRGSSTRRR